MPPGTVQHADQSLVKKLAEILTRCIYAVGYGIAGKGKVLEMPLFNNMPYILHNMYRND